MKSLLFAVVIAGTVPQWYVEITSPNFPEPFKIAGGYSSKADCDENLPDIIAEWSAKTYQSGSKKGLNSFGTVTAKCKFPGGPS
jgi:hypothetical protein